MLRETIKRWFGFPTVEQYHKSLLAELQIDDNKDVKKAPVKKSTTKKAPIKKKAAVKKSSPKKTVVKKKVK